MHPDRQNIGIGRALMGEGLARARANGHELVLLVGDEPYYGRVGFKRVPDGQLDLPGPVDPDRLLYLELMPGALRKAQGWCCRRTGSRKSQRPSRYHMAETASSSAPRLSSVENSGISVTAGTR